MALSRTELERLIERVKRPLSPERRERFEQYPPELVHALFTFWSASMDAIERPDRMPEPMRSAHWRVISEWEAYCNVKRDGADNAK